MAKSTKPAKSASAKKPAAKATAKKASPALAKVKANIANAKAKVAKAAKPEPKPTMLSAKATPKEMADTLITVIRKDLSDVTKHGASEAKFRKMIKAMFKAMLEAKGIK